MPTRELVTESNSPDRSGFSRRDLLGNAALIGAGFAVGPLWFAACADQSKDINNRIDRAPDRGASDMKTRTLGALEVSELGSGCMSISANYGPPADRNQGITVIREA
jgi:hypothetical protein